MWLLISIHPYFTKAHTQTDTWQITVTCVIETAKKKAIYTLFALCPLFAFNRLNTRTDGTLSHTCAYKPESGHNGLKHGQQSPL